MWLPPPSWHEFSAQDGVAPSINSCHDGGNQEGIIINSQTVVVQELSYLPHPLKESVSRRWQAFVDSTPEAGELPFEVANSLPLVWAASDYAAGLCERKPSLLLELAREDLLRSYGWEEYNDRLIALLLEVRDEQQLSVCLRQFRQREMLRIIWRDIAGWAELMETTRELSHLAEASIDQALHKLYVWHCEQYGTPFYADGGPMNMVVLGMGKLGAWELNLSSDIDLIFAFAEEGQTIDGPRSLTHGEFFTRLGQKLIAALDQQIAEGFVFRVDMRLRPFGDSGPLVSSFSAMETYYQLHGREWERYAMVKARVVGGDREAGEQLMGILRPFVYRRYIDYGVFESLREMKAMIAREVKRKGMEDNIKLGAGGIREIEFIGQAFQLIRGGRDSKLTARKILKVLAYLAEADYLPAYVVEELSTAYIFLRTVEHRLQEVADQQTHVLPGDDAGRMRLAFCLGYENWAQFCQELDHHRQRVQEHFEQVFESPQGEQAQNGEQDLSGVWLNVLDEADSLAMLQRSGFARPEVIYKRLAQLRKSRAYHGLSKLGRSRLDRLLPLLLAAAGQAEGPDGTALRLLDLLSHIAQRSVYLALLVENPLALSQLVKLVSASAWIASYLQKFPLLLDELLDPRNLYAPPDKTGLQKELRQQLARLTPEDQEQSMDALRHFKHINVLRVAAADISGVLPLMKVSDHLTWIAECVLDGALELAWQHMLQRHGSPPCDDDVKTCDKGFAIIGYGKLGGYELGYGSDLDLVFLHGGGNSGKLSDGKVPVETPVFYARLGQRLIHVLTAYTPAGSSYEIDMRLRPDGASGMLVSSLKAYAAYQKDKAWLWEHQALVRARPVAGDPVIGERFAAIRREVLARPRDHAELVRGIVEMRQRMRENLDTSNPQLFDLKQGPGGLVDIEFIVQYGVLAHAHAHPELLQYTDNVRLLEQLGKAGLLSRSETQTLADAYRDYRGTVHRRALAEQSGPVEGSLFVEQRQAVQAIWQRLFTL